MDLEIEEKLDALAEPVLSRGRREDLKQAVWNLDQAKSIRDVMAFTESDAGGI